MKKLPLRLFLCLYIFIFYFSFALPAKSAPLQAIPSLELQRYLGTWYEIAKYPNRFQKLCAANTSAVYSLDSDGQVKVVNRCLQNNGQIDDAAGVAKQIGGPTSAQLKVRFAPSWLSFLPWAWGDYWVIDLDENYQWAVVSEPGREYLWVLSRQPKMDAEVYQAVLKRLVDKGLDPGRLTLTPQSGDGR
jgi:apolipoprotein D and lipocalin family protein